MFKRFKDKTLQTLKSNDKQQKQYQNEGDNTVENFKERKISFNNPKLFQQFHNLNQLQESKYNNKKFYHFSITNKTSSVKSLRILIIKHRS